MIKVFKDLETELKLRGFSNETIKAYIYHNKKFIEFISQNHPKSEFQATLAENSNKRHPQNVSKTDLKAYLAHLLSDKSLSPASVNLVISALKFYYLEVLKKDIFAGIKHPKPEKKVPVVLTKDEVRRMIELTKNRKHNLLIELLYSTGIRVSEAVKMRIKDINFEEKVAFVKYGKGKKERFVKLSNRFIPHLKSYLKRIKKDEIYLLSYKSNHLSQRQAQRIVKKAAFAAGIKKNVFCHALRSSFATHLLESGTDIRIIQELLGHSSLTTTQKYTKLSKEMLMEVKNPLDRL